jgi:hypothetical protein
MTKLPVGQITAGAFAIAGQRDRVAQSRSGRCCRAARSTRFRYYKGGMAKSVFRQFRLPLGAIRQRYCADGYGATTNG